MYYLCAQEACNVASKSGTSFLSQEDANRISRAENGITFILEFLKYWEKQDSLQIFDWEYLAMESKDFLEWVKQNQQWRWERIPHQQIEKIWSMIDYKL